MMKRLFHTLILHLTKHFIHIVKWGDLEHLKLEVFVQIWQYVFKSGLRFLVLFDCYCGFVHSFTLFAPSRYLYEAQIILNLSSLVSSDQKIHEVRGEYK